MTDKKKANAEESPFLNKSADYKQKNIQECEKSLNNIDEDVDDTTCGFWIFKNSCLQSLANENVYVVLYGFAGCVIAMAFSYFSGTITTLEKRYKIPTRTTGFISVGNDISAMLASAFLGYYGGRGHRPRWMGIGLLTVVVFCLMTALPHFLYGPGQGALELTSAFGQINELETNTTRGAKSLCNKNEPTCIEESGLWAPILILFVAQFISGIGCAIFYTLGLTYMDDNTTKSKSPAMLSWSTFVRMLGPAIGYSLASFCLRVYIAPSLTPVITNEDPRWLGAWWLGWLILAGLMFLSAITVMLFPKELPKAKARRLKALKAGSESENAPKELSLRDMITSVKQLADNKVYRYNTLASILYFFGYLPYWIFTPKYIETQYRQSAATASMVTGSVALGFSAAGVLVSGCIISKFRPSARKMAAWNGIVDLLTAAGILCYIFIGCDGSDNLSSLSMIETSNCSASCYCDYVHYAPICGGDNITYISACHAGCTGQVQDELGHTTYSGCACIPSSGLSENPVTQVAMDGACPVDCYKEFLMFVAVMCFLKLVGATARSTNLLIALRCVPAEDKSFALGVGSMIISLVTFIPGPIFFGWLLDNFCLVWGKTCSSRGNCWLYDTKALRHTLNLTSFAFIVCGGVWNIAVWYHAKDLKIFDDDEAEIKTAEEEHLDMAEAKHST